MAVRRPSHSFAVQLRRNSTEVERRVWRAIRARQLGNAKFRRQAPLGQYVVDFLCIEAMLIVELDGGQHAEEDQVRQAWLTSEGYRLLRFWNNEVNENLDGVLTAIATALDKTGDGGRAS